MKRCFIRFAVKDFIGFLKKIDVVNSRIAEIIIHIRTNGEKMISIYFHFHSQAYASKRRILIQALPPSNAYTKSARP